jgi:diguanylate cyclase (GGDEF)-like protein
MSAKNNPQLEPEHPQSRRKNRRFTKWFLQPSESLLNPLQRRSRLLKVILLALIVLTFISIILVLLFNDPASHRRGLYLSLIIGIVILLLFSYALNSVGRFQLSAGLLITAAVIGPWGSILFDPEILQGDFIPLVYLLIPILLSSILLPFSITLIISAVQSIGLFLLSSTLGSMLLFNWASFFSFVVMFSIISILNSVINQNDLYQIESQNQQLELIKAQLRELSIRDHLTGLFNRRYLDEALASEIERAARKQYSIGIIMIDIDHYKVFNDTFGHAAGDEIIIAIAELQKKLVRTYDIACRYGGDEFVLILPESSLATTRERAEHLRTSARQLQMTSGGQELGTITLSAGVAVYPDHGLTVEDLLKAADDALYTAKQAGRDRVVVAGRQGKPPQ